jgi:hypothetical protein
MMNAYERAVALERRAAQSRVAIAILIALAVLTVVVLVFRAGDRHRAEADRIALAGREYRVADSVSRALAPKIARVDTLVVHDTVKVRVAITRVATLTDTVLHHLTDTVLVKEYVARSDTALKACSELSHDCAQFRSFAIQKFAADSNKFVAFRASIPKPPRFGFRSGLITGVAAVLAAIHFTR